MGTHLFGPPLLDKDSRIKMEVSLNRITVSRVQVPETSVNPVTLECSHKSSEIPVDLTNFPGTPQELQKARAIFEKHSDIFLKEGDTFRCTPSIKHEIRTKDDLPVSQPFYRIPPEQW